MSNVSHEQVAAGLAAAGFRFDPDTLQILQLPDGRTPADVIGTQNTEVNVTQNLGDVGPGSTVIGYDGRRH